jgi:MoxR-like ATPase
VYQADEQTVALVNAAIYLRRPLLVTGKPGTGKSTLARSIAYELSLGPVLSWPVTSRSTLREALYQYDAIGRLESGTGVPVAARETDTRVGRYITLGPLGTAMLAWRQPRVLLIDELDKSDIDLPNDLLHIFEEGTFDIPELARLPEDAEVAEVLTVEGQRVAVRRGHVRCLAFPIIVITSNGEREFPPAFLRRCVRVDIKPPQEDALVRMVDGFFGNGTATGEAALIEDFLERRELAEVATDQLLNAIYLATSGEGLSESTQVHLRAALLRELDSDVA